MMINSELDCVSAMQRKQKVEDVKNKSESSSYIDPTACTLSSAFALFPWSSASRTGGVVEMRGGGSFQKARAI
jgi:hypothetical protein